MNPKRGLPPTQGENAWLEDHFPPDEQGSRTGSRSNENRSVGYVLKTSGGSKLIGAILAALGGKTRVTRKIKGYSAYGRSHLEPLTWRQREVVQLLAEGKTMKEAAVVCGACAGEPHS